jgi:hypothetical protein
MKKLRRLKIIKFVLRTQLRRSKLSHFKVMTLKLISDAVLYLNRSAQGVRGKYLKRQTAIFLRESEPIISECQKIKLGTSTLTQMERQLAVEAVKILSTRSLALTARMQRQVPVVGRGVILYLVQSFERKTLARMKKFEALQEIISQKIDDPTFYYALLLWFVIPSVHVDSCLGDLDEEYEIRRLSRGEAVAKAWYQNQVVSSAKAYLWARLERFVAIGSLIEWIFHLARKSR